jgi:hypothetical protein
MSESGVKKQPCIHCGKERNEHPHLWCSEDYHDRRMYARRLVSTSSDSSVIDA